MSTMTRPPTALVIGAGLGGIAAAAYLAQAGFAVQVLEKTAGPGGRCGQLLCDGHRFDIGPTLLLMPELFAQAYAALGEHMEDHLDLCRIDPTYRIHFDDGAQLSLTSDLTALQAQVEALEPGSFGGVLRYLAEGQQHYHLARRYFLERNFANLPQYLSPPNVERILFPLHALQRHYERVGRYVHHPHLKAAFTFQNMYLGLSPYTAPATYSLLPYTELADGVWFPRGGLYRVVESLTALATDRGVSFRYQAPVRQIVVEGARARGVELEDGSRLSADVIVANADLPYVYRHLLPDRAAALRMEHLAYTSSALMFYWGLDTVYPQLGPHTVFLAGDYHTSFERIFHDRTLPDVPSVYIHAPARVDPSAAPAGQDTLLVLVPVGHLDERRPQDWEALRARARAAVLAHLDRIGIHDLNAHLRTEVSYTPRDWQRLYNLERGAAFGLSHNVLQVGYLRPHNQHRRYRNLYFVGASTHPGGGVPLVLLSARLTAERILRDSGVASPTPIQTNLADVHPPHLPHLHYRTATSLSPACGSAPRMARTRPPSVG